MKQLTFETMRVLPIAVLEQDKVWQDARGVVRSLEELDPSHLARLEPFLLRKGERLRWKWLELSTRRHVVTAPTVVGENRVTGEVYYGPSAPVWSDNGGNLDNAFDEWVDYEMDRPLAEWLAARPLVKRVRELLEEQQ